MPKATLDIADRPSWLKDAPSGAVPDPPVSTRKSRLPLGELGWEDFERLCLRLAEVEGDPEHWQIFGTAGQDQGGIDILVRPAAGSRYVVWQSKRYQTMTPARLKAAVDRFLAGAWAAKTDRFILATSADLTDTKLALAVESQAVRLKARGVIFDARDTGKLSTALKRHPRIVDDFFDRPWTEKFCGAAVVRGLEERLPRGDYARLRQGLREIFDAHVASVDPGLLRAAAVTAAPPRTVRLTSRYVPHDLIAPLDPGPETRSLRQGERETGSPESGGTRERSGAAEAARPRERQRIALDDWAGDGDNAVVIGPPGAGKSTLLRYLALDLLAPSPRLSRLHERWGGRLPIWVSFPHWTRLVETSPTTADISLEAAASAWLSAQGRPEMVDLVKQALKTGQAVLLVDGVDEWSSEVAAGTALALLSAYCAARRLPAIVTSRPHASRLFVTLDARWRRYDLAPLTQPQQVAFASAWLQPAVDGARDGELASSISTRARAVRIIADINRAAEIAALATTPLMLGGLLAMSLEGASLPRSRYAAYRELTARLLESHPRARGMAALAQSQTGDLDLSTRRRVLAALAFHIQEGGDADAGFDAVDTEAAVAFCAERVAEILSLPPADANAHARRLIAVGAETLGILVEKSPTTVGFLHRAFQEFLAAGHVNAQDIDTQRRVFQVHAGDPRWRDVLLFSAQTATRESEVATVVDAIEAGANGDAGIDWSRDLLLCDLAFSDVVRSAPLTRRLAERVFAAIEAGPFETQRVDFLQTAIAGLGAEQTALLVRPRLEQWFPQWTDWNHGDALRLIAKWPEPDVDEVLWRSLQSDRDVHARMAAEGLALRRQGDETWRLRFAVLLREATRATAVAAALAGLAAGWKEHPDTAKIVDRAAGSQSRIIGLAGIEGRIALNRHDDADRDRLIEWMMADDLSFDREIPSVLACGWPHWSGLRDALLSERQRWFRDPALTAAIKAFPGDDDVARYLVGLLEGRDGFYAFHSDWSDIRDNFAGHPLLTAALEARIDEVKDGYALANAAYVARTDIFKARLISRQREATYLDFWLVDALLDLWPDDPEVKEVLASLIDWDDDQLSEVAHRLPEIMPDAAACRARLLDLLKTRGAGRHGRADRILKGLAATGPIADDEEILAAALRLDADSEYFWAGVTTAVIIEQFKDRPEVQAFAKRRLRTADGLTGVIALCQGHISEMRAEVLKVAAPLPEFLRITAVEALRDRAIEDDFALSLLESAQNEAEEEVCMAALIAVAEVRVARGDVSDVYVEALERQLQAIGPRMGGRRLGAVAGLGIAGRGDIVQKARLGEPHLDLRHLRQGQDHSLVLGALAKGWTSLADAFGDTPVFEALGVSDDILLTGVTPSPGTDDAMRAALVGAMDRCLMTDHPPPEVLIAKAREPQQAGILRDVCLALIERGGRSWSEIESVLAAARILAETFRDDAVVRERIETLAQDLGSFGAICALSDGWPTSDAFTSVFKKLVALGEDVPRELWMPAVSLKVVMAGSGGERVVASLRQAANAMTGGIWDGLAYWMPSVVRRLQVDRETGDELVAILDGNPTASEILGFVSLLAAAYGVTPRLREWIEARIVMLGTEPVASTGLDLWRGRPDTLVRQRLFEILRNGV